MKKIPTLFLRRGELTTKPVPGDDPGGEFLVSGTVRPGCEWVLEGKGVATRMWDGTCCLVKDGKLWKRQTVGEEFERVSFAAHFRILCERLDDKATFWIPVTDAHEDKWHREAHEELGFGHWDPDEPEERIEIPDGTYELCGPKINGNPEGFDKHVLMRHGEHGIRPISEIEAHLGATFHEACHAYLETQEYEGIVWYHKDDEHLPYHERRMAKIKRRDFGLEWPLRELEE